MSTPRLSLPTDSDERKTFPLLGGLFGYFAAALAGIAHHSWISNEKHNKGQPLHWSMDKSNDHAECVMRHSVDLQELLHWLRTVDRSTVPADYYAAVVQQLLYETHAMGWRALALGQTLHMEFDGAPQPFNARRSLPERVTATEIAEARLEGYPGSLRTVDGAPAGEKCLCGRFGISVCDGGCI